MSKEQSAHCSSALKLSEHLAPAPLIQLKSHHHHHPRQAQPFFVWDESHPDWALAIRWDSGDKDVSSDLADSLNFLLVFLFFTLSASLVF